MNCSSLPPFDPGHPDACLRTGSRPPVPDLTDLIRNPDPEMMPRQKDITGLQQRPGQTVTQSPDLLPIFVSFGVLILLTLIIILLCFIFRRSQSGYSNNVFNGGSRAMRTFCGKAAGVGKKQPGRHIHHQNSVEMKQPIGEINTCPETTPFVANSYPTATSPNLERRLSPTRLYHQYQTPKNVLMIPPPSSPAPPPPPSNYSPFDPANHRAFTQVYSSQVDREMDGGEKQFFMANSGLFAPQTEQVEQLRQQQVSSSTPPEPMDRSLQTINYPLVQIRLVL